MQITKSLLAEFGRLCNISHIRAKARELARQLDSISLDSVISFAESHFIQIRLIPGFPEAAFGYSDVKDGIRYIYLNRNTSECQMTFTIVHELGHHLLDHYPINRPRDLLDLEANLFVFFVCGVAPKNLKLDELTRENKDFFTGVVSLTVSALMMLLLGSILDLMIGSSRSWNHKRGSIK